MTRTSLTTHDGATFCNSDNFCASRPNPILCLRNDGPLGFDLVEFLEQAREVLWFDADAGVLHGQLELIPARRLAMEFPRFLPLSR